MNTLTSSPLESSVWKLVWREGRYIWAVLQCQAPEYCGKADGFPLGKAKLLLNQLEECELASRESSKVGDEKVTEGRKWICRRGCFCAVWQLAEMQSWGSLECRLLEGRGLMSLVHHPVPSTSSNVWHPWYIPTTSCVILGSCLTLFRFPHL